MCTNGIVASEHPLASEEGVNVLRKGGNAVDAAVTVNSILNVVDPGNCGMGGDVFYLIYIKDDGKVTFLNGSGRSAENATIDLYEEKGLKSIPSRGPLSAITVPGCVDGWSSILKKYGSTSFRELLQPAIRYAEQGFPISHTLSKLIKLVADKHSIHPGWKKIFLPQGRALEPGEILVQKDLADSFRAVAEGGREAFYNGIIAENIARFLGDQGGLITMKDFEGHSSVWNEPVKTNYHDYTVYETAPNSQALTTLIALNILENIDISSLGYQSLEHLHLMIEASKIAYAARDRYIGDPEFIDIPVDKLVSKEYAMEKMELIKMDSSLRHHQIPNNFPLTGDGDTTYFAVVDNEGNCVSCIQSLYGSFGSGMIAEGTGIVLQNRGSYFSLDRSHHNQLGPRKRTLHTLCASMVLKDNEPFLIFGSMGGDIQPQIHLQVFSAVIDFNIDIQEAIESPRWSMPKTIYSSDDRVILEGRFPKEVVDKLKDKGHDVIRGPDYSWSSGFAQGVVIKDGVLFGGADPRGDGAAIGY